MVRIEYTLDRAAYCIACLSPFSLLWIQSVGPAWSHKKGLFAQFVIWSPSYSSVAAVVIGMFCVVFSYVRLDHTHHMNYAKAAMVLGTISALGISLVAPICLPAKPDNYQSRKNCLTNIKLINLSLIMYVQDYDERWPQAPHWADDLAPYVKNAKIFQCPAEDDQRDLSYGFNQALSGAEMSRITNPASMVDVIDAIPGKNRTV